MKIFINPKYRNIQSFIEQVPSQFHHLGKTIYKSRNEIKVVEAEGLLLNIKEYKVPHCINRIVYSSFRKPKCVKAYEYAIKLRGLGVETPEPVGYIILSSGGLISKSYFISIQSSYDRRFYEFGEGGIAGREHILIAFAKYTAYLHTLNIYHRDYSPGNILFAEREGELYFSLVDINRMKFGSVSFEKGCRNFARLWGQEDFFILVATEYAKARNFDVDKTIDRVLHYRNAFWKRSKREIPFEL